MPRRTKAQIAIDRERVMALRVQGITIRAIAERTGMAPMTVHRDIKAALDDLAKKEYGHTTRLRMQEVARLEMLLRSIFPDLARERPKRNRKGEPKVKGVTPTGEPIYEMEPVPTKERLAVVDRVLRIQIRMSKLLGLDAPDRLEADITAPPTPLSRFVIVHPDGSEEEVDPGALPEESLGGRP